MNLKKKIKNAVARGKIAESRLDSAKAQNLGENISSLRDSAKQNRGKPPCKKNIKSQGGWLFRNARKSFGLPRSLILARNDKFLDSSLRKCSAQNGKNSVQVAESSLKIGIVIPIYNVAPYLRECLDSVLNQTYKNFHAVLVNDGSTDNSKEIALEYVAKDSRFTLIDKENGGLSNARNAGIKYFSQSAESSKNNLARSAKPPKSFCYFWLLPKVESPLPLNPNLPTRQTQNLTHHYNAKSTPNPPQIDYIIFLDSDDFWENNLLEFCVKVAESRANSATRNNSSLRADSQNLRGNQQGFARAVARSNHPPLKKTQDLQGGWLLRNARKSYGLPRSHSLARNDNILHTQNNAEFALNLQNLDIIWFGFTPTQQGAKLDPLDAFGFKDIAIISPHDWVQRAQKAGIGQFWFSWGGMIDFRFLRAKKLQFLEGALYEDELFGLQVFAQSRAICVLPKKLYHYRIRENSIASSAKKKSLPPFLAHLRAHFSDENLAWEYACASSFARILVQSVALFDNLSDRALAEALKRAFLPTLFARSCEILAFKCDLHSAKARVVVLLKENGYCLSTLKIIAKIPHKRARYTMFLSYFAPKLVWFRIKKRIKLLFGAESSLDSANSQNLDKKSNKKSLLKFLLLLAFAKSRVPPNPTDSNPPNKADSQNLEENILSLRDSAKQNRGKPPCEKNIKSQGGLPRSHSLARNDKFLDSAKSGDLRG